MRTVPEMAAASGKALAIKNSMCFMLPPYREPPYHCSAARPDLSFAVILAPLWVAHTHARARTFYHEPMGDAYRVVILGGGFGGLNAAKALKSAPAEVTLVDRRNFHLFQPLMTR